jgi:hypothetical protein
MKARELANGIPQTTARNAGAHPVAVVLPGLQP